MTNIIHPPVHTLEIKSERRSAVIRRAAYEAAKFAGSASLDDEPTNTEIDAINALVDMQRANGDAIDPNGARRLVRSLVALGLLRFE